jgi:hypothetical protein
MAPQAPSCAPGLDLFHFARWDRREPRKANAREWERHPKDELSGLDG